MLCLLIPRPSPLDTQVRLYACFQVLRPEAFETLWREWWPGSQMVWANLFLHEASSLDVEIRLPNSPPLTLNLGQK